MKVKNLILIVILFFFLTSSASAWIGNYTYRIPITITNPQGKTHLEYQYNITIWNSTGTNTSTDLYLKGTIGPSFDDTQFSRIDGSGSEYNISFVAINKTNIGYGSSATFWFKIFNVINGANTVYFYWNQSGTPTGDQQNGKSVFPLYDHFDGIVLNASVWNSGGDTGNITISNSRVNLNASEVSSLWIVSNTNQFLPNTSLIGKFIATNIAGSPYDYNISFGFTNPPMYLPMARVARLFLEHRDVLTGSYNSETNISIGNMRGLFQNYEIARNQTITPNIFTRIGTTSYPLINWSFSQPSISPDPMGVDILVGPTDAASGLRNNISVDYVFVRNYSYPEPYVAGFGVMQTAPFTTFDMNMTAGYNYTIYIRDTSSHALVANTEIILSGSVVASYSSATGIYTNVSIPYGIISIDVVPSSGYYGNSKTLLVDADGSTTIYLTAIPSQPTKTTFWTPHNVAFTVFDVNHQKVTDTIVTATAIESTLPGGYSGCIATLQDAYGIPDSEARKMLNSTILINGTTDSTGSISFLMLPTIKYYVNVTRGGSTQVTSVYPKEDFYTIQLTSGSYTQPQNVAGYNSTSYDVLNMTEPDVYHIKFQLFYYDANTNTDYLMFWVKCETNQTYMNWQNVTVPGLKGPVLLNYTVENIVGEQWRWGYEASHPV